MSQEEEKTPPTHDEQIADVYALHDHGIYLPTRTLYLGSDADSEGNDHGTNCTMADRFVKNMHILDTLSDAPINVIMNNVGGDEYHGAAIFDAIRHSRCNVIGIVRGHAMSMGSVILQACDVRRMGYNATQMIHYGTWGSHDHAKTAAKIAREGERLNAWMEQIYLLRIIESGHPEYKLEALRHLLDHDTFLDAEQSINLGLADEIG